MPIVHSIPLALSRLVTLERPEARPQPAKMGHYETRQIKGLMEVL